GMVDHGTQRYQVVTDGVVDGDEFRFAQGDTHGYSDITAVAEPAGQGGGTVIGESHPVDHSFGAGQPEHPGPGITRLWDRGDGTGFDEPEPQGRPGRQGQTVLVHPCSQ